MNPSAAVLLILGFILDFRLRFDIRYLHIIRLLP